MATRDIPAAEDLTLPDFVSPRIIGLGLFVMGWYALAGVFPNELMPYPLETLLLTWELVRTGVIVEHLADTLLRTFIGFVGALLLGTVVGIFMGANRFGQNFFLPYVIVGISIPAIAWAAVGLLIFSFSIWATVSATVAVTFPFISINIWKGVESIDSDLIGMSKSFRTSNTRIIRRVIIPNAAPEIFTGIRFGMAISWKIVTIAELFSASSGVGYKLVQSYEAYMFERAWAWAAVFMIVILAIEYLILRPLERRAYRYRQDADLDKLL